MYVTYNTYTTVSIMSEICTYLLVHMFIIIFTTGAELTLRHIRDGVELEPIDVNRNYDFNFQQFNFIPRVQILPVSS